MGKIQLGILGGFSGKVGTVVGSIRDGKATMRSLGYRNTKNVSEKQIIQRERFALSRQLIGALEPALKVGYREFALQKNIPSFSISQILTPEIITTASPVSVNYENLFVSKGGLFNVHNPTFELVNRVLTINWEDNTGIIKGVNGVKGVENDEVYLVLFYPAFKKMEFIGGDLFRSTQQLNYSFNAMLPANTEVECYLFTASITTAENSNSMHFKITI